MQLKMIVARMLKNEDDRPNREAMAPPRPSDNRFPRMRVDDRAAASRLSAALGHSLAIVRRLATLVGEPSLVIASKKYEESLERATLAEEYCEAASGVMTHMRLPAAVGGGKLDADVYRGFAQRMLRVARALELDAIAKRLGDSNDKSALEGDPQPLLEHLDKIHEAVTATRQATEVLEGSLHEVEDGIKSLAHDESDHSRSLEDCKARIEKSKDVQDLESLRQVLLSEIVALRTIALERGTRLDQLHQQSRSAQRRAQRLMIALADATTAARTDPLTALGNRRAMEDAVEAAARLTSSTGILALDVDHFKKVNDTYGHPIGDRVLVAIADELRAELRGDDGAFRIGGEELLVMLARCEREAAVRTAERLRSRIAARMIKVNGMTLAVTVSIGVSVWSPGIAFDAAHDSADSALYKAKQTGRNRVMAG